MKAETGLAEQLAKDASKELIERRKICLRAVGSQPIVQPLVGFTDNEGHPLLHIPPQTFKGE